LQASATDLTDGVPVDNMSSPPNSEAEFNEKYKSVEYAVNRLVYSTRLEAMRKQVASLSPDELFDSAKCRLLADAISCARAADHVVVKSSAN
jgi:hypothetical protein